MGIASQVLLMRYMAVASTTLLFYEYAISFGEEVDIIWPSQLSVTKIIFLLNRYPPFATAATATFIIVTDSDFLHCKLVFMVGGVLTLVGYISAEATLYLRSYALWNTTRYMAYVLCTIVFLEVSGTVYVTTRFLISFSPSPIHIFPTGCELLAPNRIEWVALSILLLSETFTLLLLVIKRSVHSRLDGSVSTLLRTMLKDGVLYFVGVLAGTIANLLCLLLAPQTFNTFLLIPQSLLHSILCNRLLLSIRSVDRDTSGRSPYLSRSSGRPQLTSIVFCDE